ncbi:MAG: hypothetical protein KAS22_07470 [Candidatus Heimdallarchaeota archaeon]|nr:hypothetical protein [Candidatus Heimdallarchaeota archaeon]
MAKMHCAKGPNRCKTCKEYAKERKVALLDTSPDDPGLIARPMIEIEFEGEKIFVPFDVLAYFDTFEEAKEYAAKNNIVVSILTE